MATPNELSFLPENYLERKVQQRTNMICASLFLLMVAGIGSAFSVAEKGRRNLARTRLEVDRQYAEAARPIQRVKELQAKQKQMAEQAELAASLLERVPRSYVLARLTNALPAGVSLADFVLESRARVTAAPVAKRPELRRAEPKAAEPARNEPRRYDVHIKVTGMAPTDVQVAALITQLSRCSLFRDVNLVISEELQVAEHKMRKFQIELALVPEAQVTEAQHVSADPQQP